MKKMQTHPPVDFVVAAMVKNAQPKPLREGIHGAGLPVRKGRVKKRWQPMPAKSK